MTNTDWWARKLAQNPVEPRDGSLPQTHPTQATPHVLLPRPEYPKVNYDSATDQIVSKASSSRRHDRCPECGSGNYAPSAPGSQRLRCFDCGYPVLQQTSGLGSTSNNSGTAAIPAKQVASGGFTWNIGERME